MNRIPLVDPAEADGKAKILLDAVQEKLGVTPNMTRAMANAPAVLAAYLGFSQALAGGRLDAKTREALALTVAGINGCRYCASAHTAVGRGLGVPADELAANLDGRSADPRLDAVLDFAAALTERRGRVSDTEIAALRLAGVSDGEMAEIIAVVALNFFTNLFNIASETEVDFPLVEPRQAAA